MSNKRTPGRAIRLTQLFAVVLTASIVVAATSVSANDTSKKKIVFLAGTVHQGPGGHPPGTHEYELTARLLARALAEEKADATVEIHFDGWPRDERTLDDADTIVVISDGSDRNLSDHPLLVGNRLDVLEKQMDRGCGLVAIHWSTFMPNDRGGPEFLEWIGGYFDYQSGKGERPWFSKIQTAATRPHPASPEHLICRGLKPFDLREEYYYNIRFRPDDKRLTPILATSIPGEQQEQVVAWAVERTNGGRGFGFTGGHFFENWGVEDFRRMVLNAILWTAHLEVPVNGTQTSATPPNYPPVADADRPIQAVIVTGHQHPAHVWRETTPALQEALVQDKRVQVTVVTNPEFLASENLATYDVVVLNYCNWQRPGLSDAAKANFQQYLSNGGGLALIHFSNGAFHASLPESPPSDWPEYRNICRRVWDHTAGKSSHDPFGRFKVNISKDHPITTGLSSYETIDELYCNQQGEEPIEVLATAHSTVTGRDEPMAFVYPYGKGRIFQTVLGHAAESIRTPGTAKLIRRGTVWAAGAPQRTIAASPEQSRPAPPRLVAEGKFGAALDARAGSAWAEHKPNYDARPLTVECWAKLDGQDRFNILVASNSKESAEHWELYTYAGSGELSLYMPGYAPAEIKSGVDVVDGRWHYLAAAFDDNQARLFVDGELVRQVQITRQRTGGPIAPLHFGGYPPHNIGCDGIVDEVRISNKLRDIKSLPGGPFAVASDTIGLWHFDELDADRVLDSSRLGNAAAAGSSGTAVGPMPTRWPADPALQLISIDTSANESFLSLRTDTTGRLFAGAREALFVYEPIAAGGYAPRQLLYRFPRDTWITDIEIRGNDLYVMTNAALYRLVNGRVKRDGLLPERLLWGSPVDLHVTWHGLAWGPEGDLYFSSGDPLLNYGDFQRRPDHFGHWIIYGPNEKVSYTGVGGFYRCKPDGTNLQVVAGGTRGAVGIAFDRRWNLFSNDNDHESIADRYSPARLLHVAPKANFFWPRGWIASMSPERSDLLDVVNTGMGREVPVGQAYLDEPSLGERYRDSLLVARWGQRRVSGYSLSAHGATFSGDEYPLLVGEETARPVGVTVGRGGRVFVALSYMAGNEWSPKYPSEIVMLTRADDEPPYPFDPYDATTVAPARLWSELGSNSSQRRQQAHLEILRRGDELLHEGTRRLQSTAEEDPAFLSLIWVAAASESTEASKTLQLLTKSENPLVRQTAVRALHAFPNLAAPTQVFSQAVADKDAGVRHAGVVALFDLSGPLPEELIAGPAQESDTYIRQATALLLARRGTLDEIQQLLASADPKLRLCGVLAAGFRLTVPPAMGELPSELSLKYESGNAAFEIQYADAKIDLKSRGRVGSFTVAERWKQLPHSSDEMVLYDHLVERLQDADNRVHEQAAYFLSLFDVPQANELVARVRRTRLLKRLAASPATVVREAWTIGPFDDGDEVFQEIHPLEQGPIDLVATFSRGADSISWNVTELTPPEKLAEPKSGNSTSQYYYFRIQSLTDQAAQLDIGALGPSKVWHNGQPLAMTEPLLLSLDPGSNDLLLRVATATPVEQLSASVRAVDRIEVVLPEKLGLGTLAERLRAAAQNDTASMPAEFLAVDWNSAVATGDAERGRRLFGADALGCVKCHAVLPNQKGGGAPSLAGANKRFTASHLVESILAPSKQVAPVFGTTTIVTAEGQTLSGLVVEEDDALVVLLLPNATRQSIAKADIEARKLQNTSPMPSGLVKTPAELADLLAYLLGENPQAP